MSWLSKIFLILGSFTIALIISIGFTRAQLDENQIKYGVIERSQYIIHTATVPNNNSYIISPKLSSELKLIDEFLDSDSIAAINAGFFDPVNQKTTSFIIQDSKITADPSLNNRLVENPDLEKYLPKILNRSEFRRYKCQDEFQYDIQSHFAPTPKNCILVDSLGAGPMLLPKDTSKSEAFIDFQGEKKIRDAIGSESLNARSAIAITENNDVILVMISQLPSDSNSGIDLSTLTKELLDLGAVSAINLDGGSSTSAYLANQTLFGKLDTEGNRVKRPIKSILEVTQKQ